jgi:hypothetical protein
MFVVGSHLGMPISEVKKLSNREFVQWLAFLNLDSFAEPESPSEALKKEFMGGGIHVVSKEK